MRLTINAIGKLRKGAERQLADRYQERIGQIGPGLGVKLLVRESAESRAQRGPDRAAEEAGFLIGQMPGDAIVCALDERGRNLASNEFATSIGAWRDRAVPDLVFAIGGADGLAPSVRERADLILSFGAMTWPHQIVRVMLLEQIYRALTILAGHPYHRA